MINAVFRRILQISDRITPTCRYTLTRISTTPILNLLDSILVPQSNTPKQVTSASPAHPVPAQHPLTFDQWSVEQRLSAMPLDPACNQNAYKREHQHRVFVNRSLYLEKVKFYGFDMDYTLAMYKSPIYETLGFNLVIERLVHVGFPKEILEFTYDSSFAIRGLWFDTLNGTLLKMDSYGNILICLKGLKFLKSPEIRKLYPNKFVELDESRVYVLNTLFNLPETYILACLVNYFTSHPNYKEEIDGVRDGNIFMKYKTIFKEVREAMDWVHMSGKLKSITTQRIEEFVVKDERLPVMLDRMRQRGAKTFLLTNSEYTYTKKVMEYLLDFPEKQGEKKRDWISYFDYVVVDAQKPGFFREGTILRQVDQVTGAISIGGHTGPLRDGHIYSGGSCDTFSQLIGAKGKDVLYIGDHIFGDILKSKKIQGWRTFLVVPELSAELHVWVNKEHQYRKIQELDEELSNLYRNLDSTSLVSPDISDLQNQMKELTHEMDMAYGMLGSLFRTGSRQTFFASQVCRYADLYSSNFLNLLYYPFSYFFKATPMLMPHELTVHGESHEGVTPNDGYSMASRQRSKEVVNYPTSSMRALTPTKITHHHDDAHSDDEEDKQTGTSAAKTATRGRSKSPTKQK